MATVRSTTRPSGSFGIYQWTFPTSDRVTVSVRVTDAAGNSAVRSIEVVPGAENLAPTAFIDAGPLVAGQPAMLRAEYEDPDNSGPAAFAWDLDNDGAFDDATDGFPHDAPAPGRRPHRRACASPTARELSRRSRGP